MVHCGSIPTTINGRVVPSPLPLEFALSKIYHMLYKNFHSLRCYLTISNDFPKKLIFDAFSCFSDLYISQNFQQSNKWGS